MELNSSDIGETMLETDTTSKNCETSAPIVEELIPKTGMAFNSEDEIRDYYDRYAYQVGFGVRKASMKSSVDGQRKYYSLACAKGGKYVPGAKNPLFLRPTIKSDCKAKINLIVDGDGKCTISGVCLEHNHVLSPKKSRFQRSHKRMDTYSKRKLELNDQAGIPMNKNFNALVVEAGGYENVPFGEKDCRNHIDKIRKLRLGMGDAEALRNYFVRMQKRNSNFFYAIDMDSKGRLRNVFWADARSRTAYQSFGDVVSFDSTYLTNKYNMPFAPFVGVNHHGQSILFGCGLLSNEDIETYTWLFETWLVCMSGHHPNAIITDQCRAIQTAIGKVFHHSHHRLCLWHIMKKIPEKLGGFSDYKAIKKMLKAIVYESLEEKEFDEKWSTMIENFRLEKNEWLSSLFDDRTRWAPVYVNKIFWAGMSTTQRSESMNAFFDDYVNAKTSLKQFVEQYDNALKSKMEKENKADHESLNSTYTLITGYCFEKQFQDAYTNNIFKLFQDELRGMLFCNFALEKVEGVISIFNVIDILKGKDGYSEKRVQYCVYFNEIECDIRCTCQLFEFKGILCRHIAKILIEKRVKEIPSHYILTRWRKDVKHRHYYVKNCYKDSDTCERDSYFNKLSAKFFEVAELAVDSHEKLQFFMKCIEEGEEKLKDGSYWDATNVTSATDDLHCASNSKGVLLSPVQVRSKGRPPSKRLASTMEIAVNQKNRKVKRSGGTTNVEQDQVMLTRARASKKGQVGTKKTNEKHDISDPQHYSSETMDNQAVSLDNQTIQDEMIWQNLSFTQLLQGYQRFETDPSYINQNH